MKVLIFTTKPEFHLVAKNTITEFEYTFFTCQSIFEMNEILKTIDIDLVILDCETFRPEKFDFLTHVHSIRNTTHCLIVETSKHELDEETLLCQISVQVMLQEIYEYRQLVKSFCKNFWNRMIDQEVNPDYCEKVPDLPSPYVPVQPAKTTLEINDSDIEKQLEEMDEFPMDKDLGGGITLNDLINVEENGTVSLKDTSHLDLPPSYTLGHPDKKKRYNYKELDPTSKKLLAYFTQNKDIPIPIPTLCQYMWNEYSTTRRNSLYVYIRRLRLFMEDDLNDPQKLVKTQKGCYQLKADIDIFCSH